MPDTERAVDPRPARTRQALVDAIFELVQEKRWDKIRVQDILDRTGFGRSTFYAHFDNKFELLTGGIPEVVLPIATSDADVPDMAGFFEHVESMQPVLRPIMSQPLLGEVMATFHRQLVSAWSDHLRDRSVPDERIEFTAEMLAASLLAVANRWVVKRCEESIAEVAISYERAARALIESVHENRPG